MALYSTSSKKVYTALYDPATDKLKVAALPSVAIISTFPVNSQAAMLALTAQQGDVAIRSDISSTFILTADDPTVLANWAQFQSVGSNGDFAGVIKMHGSATAPTGWLICDGAEIDRTTYAGLYTAIGVNFGVGDGTTTFNLPDFRGVFPRGAGTTSRTLGKDAKNNFYAATLGTYSQDKMQGHKHTTTGEISVTGAGGGAFFVPVPGGVGVISPPVDDLTNGTPRIGTETNPANLGVSFIIKT